MSEESRDKEDTQPEPERKDVVICPPPAAAAGSAHAPEPEGDES